MTPYYQDDWLTIHQGDCRAVLAGLEAGSVHTVVTSPPYWGLRDYGTATWEGGDAGCDHIGPPLASSSSSLAGYTSENVKLRTNGVPYRDRCGKCGATRIDRQLGLEPTPDEYVANMVAVFREVRRVLRDDGTLWLNLGDSYATGTGRNDTDAKNLARRSAKYGTGAGAGTGPREFKGMTHPTKPKDLVGIPWRVAFALQADGWYLRSDIIWAKPNPMPESVTDRPTKSHEYLFLLAKSERYYFDADAVREPTVGSNEHDLTGMGYAAPGQTPQGGNRRSGNLARKYGEDRDRPGSHLAGSVPWEDTGKGRNIRSVWTIATQPYPGAHFATFPPKLVEPCILAGCPEGGVVLDPFGGSGTTAMVAQHLGRRAVLIELNPDYIGQQLRRNAAVPLGLETVA